LATNDVSKIGPSTGKQGQVLGQLAAIVGSGDSADDEIVDAVAIEGLDHPGDVRSERLR